MQWTDEQRKVIETRDKNILVSAAAGSGKTAVLVERIMQLVMDKNNPVDIDKLLVVTFTKAAANEMRERILKAFEKALDELSAEDEDLREHLEKQCTYIHTAKITTIDSFCQNVIREYISLTDIDPAFRVGDNSELVLMKEDALKCVLEKWYEEMPPGFMEFVDTYSEKVGDDKIERLIEKLFNYAGSYPNPRKWIKECGALYDISSVDEWKCSEMATFIKNSIKQGVLVSRPDIEKALYMCTPENGLEAYAKSLMDDLTFMDELQNEEDIERLLEILNNHSYMRFGRAKEPNEGVKKEVSKLRDGYKDIFNDLKGKYASSPIQLIVENIKDCKSVIDILIRLTLDFFDEYSRLKKDKNILDFSDIEHIALDILARENEESGEYYQTEAAKEMAEDFVEIMIDEYQDSNYVQEVLLNAVSTCQNGKNNIFMVGDIKQSIYKFRLARPELFLEKYNTYPADESSDRIKIILAKNFRSRQQVIDSANLIFSQILTRDLGGIVYDKDSMLYRGASYEDTMQNQKAELILIDSSKTRIGKTGNYALEGEKKSTDEEEELEKIEAEAVVVANRIRELVGNFMVKDKETERLRPAQYKDIVILFRSKIGSMDKYHDILAAKGIPVSSALKESMLNTFEINAILDFLKIVDNPKQDIPFVAVLKHIFRYSENDLARIKQNKMNCSYYESMVSYEGELAQRNANMLSILEKYRHYSTYMPIHKLVKLIVDETGFYEFVSSMSNGEQRLYNINMFIEKAESYATGVYTGLFNFIRYIEKIKIYNADKEDDAMLSEDENTVKLMTIHKSKGLEFPIVFVTALGKEFNKQDEKAKVVLHSELGIGVDKVDLENRIKYPTVVKAMMLERIKEENIAEEIRVLYVALTRAKEKLILVGSGDVSGKINKLMECDKFKELTFPKEIIVNLKSFLDLIILSLVRHSSFDSIRKLLNDNGTVSPVIHNMPGEYEVSLLSMEDIAYGGVKDYVEKFDKKTSLLNWDSNIVYSDDIRAQINERFSYVYEYEEDCRIRAKHSVSDIKHAKMELDEFVENKMHTDEDDKEYVPVFMREVEEDEEFVNKGALRGSAVHRFFELFDYDREEYELKDIKAMMSDIRLKGTMTDEELELVRPDIFVKFMKTDLGRRMQQAHKNKLLFRERPFVMGMKAREVDEAYNSDELVVVQGIIDAFFYEDDEVVIVDYKTDAVNNLDELVGRYKAQLECYADAIKKVTGKKVKERIIYSTRFNQCILV